MVIAGFEPAKLNAIDLKSISFDQTRKNHQLLLI